MGRKVGGVMEIMEVTLSQVVLIVCWLANYN
jgi:hypothetical protein